MSSQPTTRPNRSARASRSTLPPAATPPDGTSPDGKRARREEVFARRERLERQARLRRRLIWAGVALVVVAGLGGLGWWLFGPTNGPKVQSFANLGQTHIAVGQSHPPYNSPPACPDLVSKLETIGRSYPSKVNVAPYPGLVEKTKHPIALTAWTKVMYLDGVDDAQIRRFIAQNKDKAPEFFPD